MKTKAHLAILLAVVAVLALSAAAFAQGATPTPDAMMQQASPTPNAMMQQASPTPNAMMEAGTATPAAMMANATATPNAMMVAPTTMPVTGGTSGLPWGLAALAGAALAVGLGLRLAARAR